jgi:hypothetical protein
MPFIFLLVFMPFIVTGVYDYYFCWCLCLLLSLVFMIFIFAGVYACYFRWCSSYHFPALCAQAK